VARSRRGGCGVLPLVLLIALVWLYNQFDTTPAGDRRRIERSVVDGGNPRRPPIASDTDYVIEQPTRAQDSVGTGFAIDRRGRWLTAQHVVDGCDRLGIATGPQSAEESFRVVESGSADAALIEDGLPAPEALALADETPRAGATGYHMGFPANTPAIVQSILIGEANTLRGAGGRAEPTLAWAEEARFPDFDHALSGISGGPTLDAGGRVVGVNSAGSDRRGRVLTTRPDVLRVLAGSGGAGTATPIDGPEDAVRRFRQWLSDGVIRQIVCDVD